MTNLEISHAQRRMFRLSALFPRNRFHDPIQYADARGSMNDARTALCIALGIPLDRIHPASGHRMEDK